MEEAPQRRQRRLETIRQGEVEAQAHRTFEQRSSDNVETNLVMLAVVEQKLFVARPASHQHGAGRPPVDIEDIGFARGGGTRFGPQNRRSEEHTSELQSLMRISYAVFCLKKKTNQIRL